MANITKLQSLSLNGKRKYYNVLLYMICIGCPEVTKIILNSTYDKNNIQKKLYTGITEINMSHFVLVPIFDCTRDMLSEEYASRLRVLELLHIGALSSHVIYLFIKNCFSKFTNLK